METHKKIVDRIKNTRNRHEIDLDKYGTIKLASYKNDELSLELVDPYSSSVLVNMSRDEAKLLSDLLRDLVYK